MKSSFLTSLRPLSLPWILLLILLLMVIIFAWPDPAAGHNLLQSSLTATPGPRLLPSPTAIPTEYLEANYQTNGVILGVVMLVLIIIGGTLGVLSRKNDHPSH